MCSLKVSLVNPFSTSRFVHIPHPLPCTYATLMLFQSYLQSVYYCTLPYFTENWTQHLVLFYILLLPECNISTYDIYYICIGLFLVNEQSSCPTFQDSLTSVLSVSMCPAIYRFNSCVTVVLFHIIFDNIPALRMLPLGHSLLSTCDTSFWLKIRVTNLKPPPATHAFTISVAKMFNHYIIMMHFQHIATYHFHVTQIQYHKCSLFTWSVCLPHFLARSSLVYLDPFLVPDFNRSISACNSLMYSSFVFDAVACLSVIFLPDELPLVSNCNSCPWIPSSSPEFSYTHFQIKTLMLPPFFTFQQSQFGQIVWHNIYQLCLR